MKQIQQSNECFRSASRSPSMNNATSCEVVAFVVTASPLFIYQLASCSNACLLCQGFFWPEPRQRQIWWHRNDNCFIFEAGSSFCIFFHVHHHIEDWTGRPAGGEAACPRRRRRRTSAVSPRTCLAYCTAGRCPTLPKL